MKAQDRYEGLCGRFATTIATLVFALLVFTAAAHAATFHVTTTADNGDNNNPTPGSLRQAVLDANENAGPDVIDFQIPGSGVQTISLTAPLPSIGGPVTIDGYTQSGASKNTLANGDNAVLLIEIDGTNAGTGFNGVGFQIHGGQSTIRGLVINRFSAYAISIGSNDPGGNKIEGCFIGTDSTGMAALPNLSVGIYVNSSSNNVIGGTTPDVRNIISGNGNNSNGDGLLITGKSITGTIIQGNYIGTDATGATARGNQGNGINIDQTTNTLIGGTTAGARNLISGNANGITAQGAQQMLIQGNYVGTDLTGTLALGNKFNGIRLGDSNNNTIGGNTAAARNIVSATQQGNGISFQADSKGNVVQGNYIGTDVTGNNALGNGSSGIGNLSGGASSPGNNKIGGAGPGEGNVISGNKVYGIGLGSDLGGHTVQCNLIGTNVAGTTALPNGDPVNKIGGGISLSFSNNNLIGGTTAGAGNIISGNNGYGIVAVNGSNGDTIQGNSIGADVNGAALGNGNTGVYLQNSSHDDTIGGTVAGAGNTIAFNGNGGVILYQASDLSPVVGIALNGNAIYSNLGLGQITAGLGIDLGSNGVTPNDNGDGDSGANHFQNTPVLTSANSSGGTTTITGTLNSEANQQYRVEFFASAQCDPSGSGEGQIYLGSTNVTTVGNDASFNVTLPVTVQPGYVITATATDPAGNTSEFSQCALLGGLPGPGTLQFSTATFSVSESAGTATITVTRAAGDSNPVSVKYSTSAGSATANGDYTNASGILNWASGDLADKSFAVPIIGDAFNENDETINLTLSNPTGGATLGAAKTSVLMIVDDDPQPTLSIADTSVAEGNSGTTPATFTVSLSAASGKTVTVQYNTVAGTATSGSDYQQKNSSLSFSPGQTSKTFTVNVVGDTTQEPDETFTVQLSNPTNATLAKSQGTCTIFNDDGVPPQPTISISDVNHAEGSNGTTSFDFTVSLSAASNQTVTVNYATADGSALAGSDYQTANSMLTFAAGETLKTISVQVIGDTQDEPNENFLVDLSNPTNATLAKAQGTGTIVNDDNVPAPLLQFSQGNYSVPEDLGALTVTVTRSGDTSGSASVNYASSDGSATQHGDYEIALGTINFAAGDTTKTFQVLINEDNYVEGSEQFTLTLSNAIGASLGSPSTATVTITDDSPESLTNPIDNAQSFVYQQYHDFLNREPDPPGLTGWTNTLLNCAPGDINCDRIHVSAAFYQSAEFQERGYFLYRFYSVGLGRKPDYAEFAADMSRVSGFLTNAQLEAAKVQFITDVMARPAYVAKYNALNNAAFVQMELQTAGVNLPNSGALINSLDNQTATRAQVLRQIVESNEVYQKYYNQAFVVMQYFGYLRRDPDALYVNWIAVLDQTNDPRGMVNGFMNSLEYRQRFGQ